MFLRSVDRWLRITAAGRIRRPRRSLQPLGAACGGLVACIAEQPVVEPSIVDCPAPTIVLREYRTDDLVANPENSRAPTGLAVEDIDGDGADEVWFASMGGIVVLGLDDLGGLTRLDTFTVDGGPLTHGIGLATADIDHNGTLDLFVAGWEGESDQIWWNDGDGQLRSEILADSLGMSNSGVFFDADDDGDLDLFVGRGYAREGSAEDVVRDELPGDPSSLYLWDNDQFVDGTAEWLPDEVGPAHTLAAGTLDADQDGDIDLWLANDYGPYIVPDQYLRNERDHFELEAKTGAGLSHFGMGVAVGDANGDELPDLYVTDLGGPDLLLGQGDGTFVDATVASGADLGASPDRLTSWAARFVDVNGDGLDDVPVAFGRLDSDSQDWVSQHDPTWTAVDDQRDALLLATEAGHFADAGDDVGFAHPGRHRPLVVADLDRNRIPEVITAGKDDLVYATFSAGCTARAVVSVQPGIATVAVGARVESVAGGRRSVYWVTPGSTGSSSKTEVYLGLGEDASASVTVTWPNGETATSEVDAGGCWRAIPEGGF